MAAVEVADTARHCSLLFGNKAIKTADQSLGLVGMNDLFEVKKKAGQVEVEEMQTGRLLGNTFAVRLNEQICHGQLVNLIAINVNEKNSFAKINSYKNGFLAGLEIYFQCWWKPEAIHVSF